MPNLPNLSSSRSFLAQSPSFGFGNNGSESYREKIRDSIQSTPRKENVAYTSRSIDLSLNRENSTFRPVSRVKGNTFKTQGINDTDHDLPTARSNLKSGRKREILFYKNDSSSQNSDGKSGNNNNNFDNQENVEFINSDSLDTKFDCEVSETNYTSRRKRFEDNNLAQNQNLNNGFNEINGLKFTERVQTARESARAPIAAPRKLFQKSDQENGNPPMRNIKTPLKARNHDSNEQEKFPGIGSNFYDESPRNRNRNSINNNGIMNPESVSMNNNYNSNISNKKSYQNQDDYNSMRSSSRTNLRDNDSAPMPMPRKRDVSTKLLPTDTNDFRIKRVSSSKPINPSKTSYQPSTPRHPNQLESQSSSHDLDRQNYSKHQTEKTPVICSDNFENVSNEEDIFFKKGRRGPPSGRRGGPMRIDIGLEPKLEPRTNSKSRILFD